MIFDPLPQQILMKNFLSERLEAVLWAEPGLGKTASVIWALDDLFATGESRGAIVVAPLRPSLCVWPDEVQEWTQFNWFKVALLRTPEGKQAFLDGSAQLYVTNFERLKELPALFKARSKKSQFPVDTIVWDELSKTKDPSGRLVKAFRPFRSWLKRHIGLTGTPASEGYGDLFAQYRLIDGGVRLGRTLTEFRSRYMMPDYSAGVGSFGVYKWKLQEGAKERIWDAIKDITLSLSREEYLNIPATRVEDIEVQMPAEAMKLYKKMEKEFLVKLKGKNIVALNAAVLVGKLQQITSGIAYDEHKGVSEIHSAKVDAIHKLVQETGEPILAASMYVHEKERLLRLLPYAEEFDEKRWNSGKCRLALCDPRSTGHGLNLQFGGRRALWISLPHSGDLYYQFNCRLPRPGQRHETIINRLICPETVDGAISIALLRKGDEQSGLMRAISVLSRTG